LVHACALIDHFDDLLAAEVPDRTDDDDIVLNIINAKYRPLAPGVALFSPSLAEGMTVAEVYLQAGAVRPGDTVLDLGAFCGDTSYFFSKAVGPAGRVLAVEPDPDSFAALVRNVRELGLDNVQVDASAVWDADGEVTFQAAGTTTSSVAEAPGELLVGEQRVIRVPTLTLESLLRRHGIDRVDFIKMDTEGAELRVLQGARALLERLRPRMVIEVHNDPSGNGCARTIGELLAGIGFKVEPVAGHPTLLKAQAMV
jgi:FkbM family methyltransferase